MGDRTRAEIRTEVRTGLGERTDFLDPTLNRLISDSERRIDRESAWPELVRTSADSRTLVTLLDNRSDHYLPVGGLPFGRRTFAGMSLSAATTLAPSASDLATFEVGEVFAIQDTGLPLGYSFHRVTSVGATVAFSPAHDPTVQGGVAASYPRSVAVIQTAKIWRAYSLRWGHADGSDQDRILEYLPPDQWRMLTDLPVDADGSITASTPRYYTILEWDLPAIRDSSIRAQVLAFDVAPNTTYSIEAHYHKQVSPMATDAARSEFDGKDEAIIALSVHTGFNRLGMLEDAARHFTIYRGIVGDAKIAGQQSPPLFARGVSRDTLPVSNVPWADPFVRRTR